MSIYMEIQPQLMKKRMEEYEKQAELAQAEAAGQAVAFAIFCMVSSFNSS